MGSIHKTTPHGPELKRLSAKGTFSSMWQLRHVTRKSLHFLVVSVCHWRWSKAGFAQWLSELEGTMGVFTRWLLTRFQGAPGVRISSSGDKGEAKGTVHSGLIKNGLPFTHFIFGFFLENARQSCGPISAWSHIQRNSCPSKKYNQKQFKSILSL